MNCFYRKLNVLRAAKGERKIKADVLCPETRATCPKTSAFTLPEVLISMVVLGISFTSTYFAITCWMLLTHRAADYTAGMALVQAKINDIRATDYPGTNGIFSLTGATTTNSNNVTVDLNKGGTSFMVPGTLTSVIQPTVWGHLVTVTLVVRETGSKYLTNSLQTVVNSYSGGRGN